MRKGENSHMFGKHLSEETKRKLSEALSGEKNPNFGKKTSEVIKKKQSLAKLGNNNPMFGMSGDKSPKGMLGKHHSNETKMKMSKSQSGENHPLFGKHHSDETKRKMSLDRSGENNPRWIDGRTPLVRKIRNCSRFEDWSRAVLVRDDFVCQSCGKRGGKLHSHHIKRFVRIYEENKIKTIEQALDCKEFWSVSNGITLCEGCHKKEHKRKEGSNV